MRTGTSVSRLPNSPSVRRWNNKIKASAISDVAASCKTGLPLRTALRLVK